MDEQNQNQEPSGTHDEGTAPETTETKELREKLEAASQQRDEYLAGWQRAKADFVNYKRDEMARFEEISKYGNEELVRELVGVLDSFDLGIRAMEKQGPVERGVYMIRSQIEDILKKWGLARIEIKSGTPFDPKTQEAIAEAEADGPPGMVLEEIEPGYRLNDKMVRPAQVKISKTKI